MLTSSRLWWVKPLLVHKLQGQNIVSYLCSHFTKLGVTETVRQQKDDTLLCILYRCPLFLFWRCIHTWQSVNHSCTITHRLYYCVCILVVDTFTKLRRGMTFGRVPSVFGKLLYYFRYLEDFFFFFRATYTIIQRCVYICDGVSECCMFKSL